VANDSDNPQEPWYLGPRAELLARLYLTRRDDLLIWPNFPDRGQDLLVEILRDGQRTGRLFAIRVQAALSREVSEPPVLSLSAPQSGIYRDLPYPAIVLLFTVDNDAGFFRWLKAPAPGTPGALTLLEDEGALTPFTNETLAGIIEDVSRWYDARAAAALTTTA
jgi:hypothetical protein